MSRNAPRLALAALVTIAGCLTPPPLPPRRDAGLRDGSDPDSPAAPFRVESVAVLDARGEPWDSSAAPRAPSIVVTFSDPLASPSDCLLLRGRLDAETIEDLTALPLRGATAELRAAVLTNASGASVMIAPEAPLAPGDVFTLAIGAWASREDGTWLGAPFTH